MSETSGSPATQDGDISPAEVAAVSNPMSAAVGKKEVVEYEQMVEKAVVAREPETVPCQEVMQEDVSSRSWKRHKKHFFVLSNAGKPIFSRYGAETSLAPLMGVMQAIISFVSDAGDTIRYIKAGDTVFVFLMRESLFYVCVSRTTEPITQLERQLKYFHVEILFILTNSIDRIFRKNPSYDLRGLLGGTEHVLKRFLKHIDFNPCFLLDCYRALRLPQSLRADMTKIMLDERPPEVLFALVSCGQEVISMHRPRAYKLHPQDVLLLLHLISSSRSFRANETWTPVCLPHFNPQGFLHAYICYLSENVCLTLITSQPTNFFPLSAYKQRVQTALESSGLLQLIENARHESVFRVQDLGLPDIRHFVYLDTQTTCLSMPALHMPYSRDSVARRRMYRLYQHVHDRIHRKSLTANRTSAADASDGTTLPRGWELGCEYDVVPHRSIFSVFEEEAVLGWATDRFRLYALFGPLVDKPVAIKLCNCLIRWIHRVSDQLFVTQTTWS